MCVLLLCKSREESSLAVGVLTLFWLDVTHDFSCGLAFDPFFEVSGAGCLLCSCCCLGMVCIAGKNLVLSVVK